MGTLVMVFNLNQSLNRSGSRAKAKQKLACLSYSTPGILSRRPTAKVARCQEHEKQTH